ncbi:DUF5695 domain-containing protein [Lentilactobacillus sp. Marseille-Q4993]|uniref:DUF5695 domain-containing protein n=1 Tax=Lentilactobacillus sp. Marseille-Q4993 TaxID=3039492 RepID=UPI0024BCFF8F|nr:DUF5695 domain-containing protein [Lentilactobacillus sp. Marseille-Q4993]
MKRRYKVIGGCATVLATTILCLTAMPAAMVSASSESQQATASASVNNSGKQSLNGIEVDKNATVTKNNDGYILNNDKFKVEIGGSGEIDGLYLANDAFDTNYVMNYKDNPKQNNAAHQWMGELMFRTKKGDANSTMPWTKEYTSQSPVSVRKLSVNNNSVVVTYTPNSSSTTGDGIKNMVVTETYTLDASGHLHWGITLKNNTKDKLTVGDFGLPMPFREYWHYKPTNGKSQLDMAYENSVIFHSFVGQNSSYIYTTRPSGIGNFLTFTPDQSTDAKLEYQDHWEDDGTKTTDEKQWSMPRFGANVAGTTGWDNGLNVFYVNSEAISPTGNRGYLPSTATVLNPGESKTYAFNFSASDLQSNKQTTHQTNSNSTAVSGDMTSTKYETNLKKALYDEGLVDAVSVPSMVLTKDSTGIAKGQMYLHTKVPKDKISFSFQNQHNDEVSKQKSSDQNKISADGLSDELGTATYKKTVTKDGENYYIYDIAFKAEGRNNIIVNYELNGQAKKTTLQYDVLQNPEKSLEKHAQFLLKTQIQNSGKFNDQIFDDWSMDKKATVNDFTTAYGGWGDDWGLTHGLFLADMNTKIPNKDQVQALDKYLHTGIWDNLMKNHHSDYGVPDWLREKNDNLSYTWRSYSYIHIYNTFYEMYKIAKQNPDLIKYDVSSYPVAKDKDVKNAADAYLKMAYNIFKACYTNSGIRYKDDGLMGESTVPQFISALKSEGMTEQAGNVENWMKQKYTTYTSQKYPFGSEMNYDNTGEESVYMLGNMYNDKRLMAMVDMKTRADRGVQPLWYQYGVPVTIDGENWWQFQYTTSLADTAMNNWLVSQDNGLTADQRGIAQRSNYAAKLGNLTQINTGQIDSDQENNGAVSWTYQAELGNWAQPNQNSVAKTGAGSLHNGWRQTSGEGDLALFGALQVLSADVATDPIFGTVGYGANVNSTDKTYEITPEDGMRQKLNLIDSQTAYEFAGDRYTKAVTNKDNSAIRFDVENVTRKDHTLQLKITLPTATGTQYNVLWNGKKVSEFKQDDTDKTIDVKVGTGNGQLEIAKPGSSIEQSTSGTGNGSTVPSGSTSSSSSQIDSSQVTSSSSSAINSSSSDANGNQSSSSVDNNTVSKDKGYKKGTMLYATKKVRLYKGTKFDSSTRIVTYKKQSRTKRPEFKVISKTKNANGVARYKVVDMNKHTKNYKRTGYITASSKYVQPLYYQSLAKHHVKVISKTGINSYKSKSFSGKVHHYKYATKLKVKKIVKTKLRTTFVLNNGKFITGNKKFIMEIN